MNTPIPAAAATIQLPEFAPAIALPSALGERGQRQLELTLGALCRAVRRAIRGAELLDRDPQTTPAAREAAWDLVDQRNATLCRFMAALQPPTPTPPAAAPLPPIPQAAEIAAEEESAPEAEMPPSAPSSVNAWEAEIRRVAQLPRDTAALKEDARFQVQALLRRIRQEAPVAERARLLAKACTIRL